MTRGSFRNAIVALAAIGGSTNAVVHLLAIAGRLGVDADARRLRPHRRAACRCSSTSSPPGASSWRTSIAPAGCSPSCARCATCSIPDAITVTGRPLVELPRRRRDLGHARSSGSRAEPLQADAGIAVLRGNLAPDGRDHQARRRVAEPAAAPRPGASCSTRSRTSTRASTTPTSTSTPTRCWCCAAAARRATRGCPRSPTCRCPTKLLEQGVRDMVRICDGRMSGTAYGTVVLHVAPEAAAGGPLGLVRTGDWIVLDVASAAPRRRRPGRRARPRDAGTGACSTPSPTRPAAGSACTSTTSCRPTPAPTSTSSSARAGRRSRASRTSAGGPLRHGDRRGQPSALRDGRW